MRNQVLYDTSVLTGTELFAGRALGIWSSATSADGSASASWMFQMLFAAACTSIVSGAIAERVRIGSFLIFAAVNSAIIYPIVGNWVWNDGWLEQIGFRDFAGATVVHSTGGWAALVACFLLGPRLNRFEAPENSAGLLPSSMPLTTLGVFLLWIGWFGFNGGSALPLDEIREVGTMANIIAYTNGGAIGGVLVGLLFSLIALRRWHLGLILNCALAGLVSVTAAPFSDVAASSFLWGGIGAGLMLATTKLLEWRRVDDVVGSVAVHLTPGIFSTLFVAGYHAGGSIGVQALGVASVAAFVVTGNLLLWMLLRATVGIRLSAQQEVQGSDLSEVGHEAYDLIDADMQHFSSFATHDLKEPLRSIHSFAQLLEVTKSAVERQQFVSNIKEASVKMGSVIDDLICYSSLNQLRTDPKEVDLQELAHEVFDRCRMLSGLHKDLKLETKGLPVAQCDRVLIGHVFNNLIENAIKYRDRSRPLLLEVEAEDRPNVWVLRFADNGQGIEQHHRNSIFQMFFRSPRATPKCTSENGSVMSVLPCGRARRWRESCKRRFAYASRLPSPDPR